MNRCYVYNVIAVTFINKSFIKVKFYRNFAVMDNSKGLFLKVEHQDLQRPERFYRYRPINKFLWDLLENNELYFATQDQLPDILDLRFELGTGVWNNIANNIYDKLFTQGIFTPMQSREVVVGNIVSAQTSAHGQRLLQQSQIWKKALNCWGVCCLTIDNINYKMWEEYADKHSGVCLEFDLCSTPRLYDRTYPVTYTDMPQVLDKGIDISKILLNKKPQYFYESEWRILRFPASPFKFNKESLTAIYFGVNISKDNYEKIEAFLNQNGYGHVKLHRAFIEAGSIIFKEKP